MLFISEKTKNIENFGNNYKIEQNLAKILDIMKNHFIVSRYCLVSLIQALNSFTGS